MKNNKRIKVFVSILCTLALLISNLSPLSWNSNSMDEVQAADWDGLTELTWSDFNITCNGVSASTDKKTLSSGKDINNSLFNGDVTMQAGSEIRYLGSADYSGLIIKVTDTGSLSLSTAAMWANELGYGQEYTADTFGLTTFANTKFNLKIAVTNYTTNSATLELYVNNQIVGAAITLGQGTMGTYMSLYTGTIIPEYALHELSWSDFGIACDGTSASTDKKTLSSGKGINNSLFNGDVTMQAGSEIRYLGNVDYGGLLITITNAGTLNYQQLLCGQMNLVMGKSIQQICLDLQPLLTLNSILRLR